MAFQNIEKKIIQLSNNIFKIAQLNLRHYLRFIQFKLFKIILN